MVFVRGPETGAIQHFVDKVVFRLHESFPKPKRGGQIMNKAKAIYNASYQFWKAEIFCIPTLLFFNNTHGCIFFFYKLILNILELLRIDLEKNVFYLNLFIQSLFVCWHF